MILTAVVLCLVAFTHNPASAAGAKRVVVVKVDGLPPDMVDGFVRERDARTGKSLLPWVEHIFYQRGTRVANFYVRGTSLSAPSWSILDSGRHLQIKGNVEYDRLMLGTYDYLNIFPFYISYSLSRRVDMPGPELFDELGIPLLYDAYPYDERFMSFQLFQRGVRWSTLQRGMQNRFTTRTPRELFDEWTMGFDLRSVLFEQTERELLEKLKDPNITYLDFYTTEFDHAAHGNRDRATHLHSIREVDALIGRIWTAIQATPEAAHTALILVSDHGINTDAKIYSQGYNLVKLLNSRTGGGHHVITKRRLMLDYSLKGVYPLVPLVTSTSQDSYYLKNQSTDYPTALLDFDGNERAAIHLRDGSLNLLHILLQQLKSASTTDAERRAARFALFSIINNRRSEWRSLHDELTEELHALDRLAARRVRQVEAQPKKWTVADRDKGIDQEARRVNVDRLNLENDAKRYRAYLETLDALLALSPETFEPDKIRIENLIAKNAMGTSNTLRELQHYPVGLGDKGLVVKPDGTLDMERSFAYVNYFALMTEQAVRNNVQPGVEKHPVDFVAVRLASNLVAQLADKDKDLRADEAVLLYKDVAHQALILARRDASPDGKLHLRFVPIKNLFENEDGNLSFETASFTTGLPLALWEDANLSVPIDATFTSNAVTISQSASQSAPDTVSKNTRAAWLNEWHTDYEWLNAVHRTSYSNGVIGVIEHFSRHPISPLAASDSFSDTDARLLHRFRTRQRALVETDLFIHANNHWNFDVRGFNPGGNHGSFHRISTHSTLMFAGGAATGIPRGAVVEQPYDSLDFVPTVMRLTNRLSESTSLPVRWSRTRADALPGRVIGEVIGEANSPLRTAQVPAASSPPSRAKGAP
ncbi:MAG: alkaline phosphatase family protein [Pyrinomonadaceae bacterium MAG19_C2-C3]|nr:alkaline phosphatase family protein [Pyrinomonadaceae bacterium MAG19_C2-C3]